MTNKKFFLIDAHALCYRAFFAVQNLRTSQGQPTNAVFGFVNTLRKILKDFKPDYIAACFDVGKKTHRQEKYTEYKIHRPPMPDDLISQIPLIKELVLAYSIPLFELEGFEADDVIATIAQKAKKKDLDVIIVSGDKDMVQLVDENIKLYDYRKDEIIDAAKAKDIYGFAPKHMVDFIGLAGDKTDNIPGVDGIGKVTATALIQEYGTLENILKNAEKLKSEKIAEKLRNQKGQALMSKELAILDSNVPIDFNVRTASLMAPDELRLKEFFERLEFRKFVEELGGGTKKVVKAKALKTKTQIAELCQTIKKEGHFVFSIPEFLEDDLVRGDWAIALNEKDIFIIGDLQAKELKEIFEDESVEKFCHNMKESFGALAQKNIKLLGKVFDVMLAGYLLEPSQAVKDMGGLCWKYLKRSLSSPDNPCEKAGCIFELIDLMQKELKTKSLKSLFEEIEIPLALVLYRMEQKGVALDIKFLAQLSKETAKEIKALEKKLYKIAGEEFNLNSPKQLSYILFEKLQLPVVKKTKTGFSTDENVLNRLADQHELPALILEYRQLAKISSTYIDALPKLIDAKTGRLHASFDQAGTETGRLSSRNPNLQNIPIRTEFGRQIRKAFVARDKNYLMISADYSQIELRILAHLSQDKNLIKAFKEDQDIHSFTAGLIFDVKPDKITKEMRIAAKRVNFGIVYGMSAFGLAKDLKVSQGEAQEFIDKYFLRYPKVSEYMQSQIEKAEKQGFVTTLLSRRRYIPEIQSDNMSVRQFAQRQAINTPVQGSAADLIKLAMIGVQKKIDEQKLKSCMTITVHDELVFDVYRSEKDQMMKLIKKEMESPLKLSVPIRVSIKAGDNWLEMKEVKA